MRFFKYNSLENWSNDICEQIAMILASDIRKYGRSVLALSGGSSPKAYLEKLASYCLPWDKVLVTLIDERHVAVSDSHSNQRFIFEHFIDNGAGAVTFHGLYRDENIIQNIELLNRNMILSDLTYSVIVLGMGTDGHCASLFPHSPALDEGLFDPVNLYSHQIAPTFPENRISMNLCAFEQARHIFIPISGFDKLKTFGQAMNKPTKSMPISFILSSFKDKISVFECE